MFVILFVILLVILLFIFFEVLFLLSVLSLCLFLFSNSIIDDVKLSIKFSIFSTFSIFSIDFVDLLEFCILSLEIFILLSEVLSFVLSLDSSVFSEISCIILICFDNLFIF